MGQLVKILGEDCRHGIAKLRCELVGDLPTLQGLVHHDYLHVSGRALSQLVLLSLDTGCLVPMRAHQVARRLSLANGMQPKLDLVDLWLELDRAHWLNNAIVGVCVRSARLHHRVISLLRPVFCDQGLIHAGAQHAASVGSALLGLFLGFIEAHD